VWNLQVIWHALLVGALLVGVEKLQYLVLELYRIRTFGGCTHHSLLTELEHWVLSASPLGMPMGPACYADSAEFTCSAPAGASTGTLDEDEVCSRYMFVCT